MVPPPSIHSDPYLNLSTATEEKEVLSDPKHEGLGLLIHSFLSQPSVENVTIVVRLDTLPGSARIPIQILQVQVWNALTAVQQDTGVLHAQNKARLQR